jgi:hypothetical protein
MVHTLIGPNWVYDEKSGWLYGPDPRNDNLRIPMSFGLPVSMGEYIAEQLNKYPARAQEA